MALHPNFPESPYAILDPAIRWFPADEALRESSSDKLMPPLVAQLRKKVQGWRDSGYAGAAGTSKSLLNWWFKTPHLMPPADGAMAEFQYYFAQREAMETIIYLYDVVGVKDKYDLMRFDSSGLVSASMFDETWRRFVVKMATGTGKTKVLSLVLAWSFYHKLYEPESGLARNFLGDRSQHHRSGPHLQGFSGPAHLSEGRSDSTRRRRGWSQLARRFSTDPARPGRGADH
jgi:type III restriction enzyme